MAYILDADWVINALAGKQKKMGSCLQFWTVPGQGSNPPMVERTLEKSGAGQART
jgi:hypothetical protein